MIRPATKQDASGLVCLIDCAGYGIPLSVWNAMPGDEASVLEIGRKRAMSVLFESENHDARRLYEAKGCKVTARRLHVAFETDRTGSAEWLLMVKDLKI